MPVDPADRVARAAAELADAILEAIAAGLEPRPEYVSVDEAARQLGVSRNTVYRRVADGRLPSRKLGGRRLIPTAALRAGDESTAR